jgi:hypothetical protein
VVEREMQRTLQRRRLAEGAEFDPNRRSIAARPKDVNDMLATLNSLFRTEPARATEDDATLLEWQRLLATATSAHERDEINDVFGKAIAVA